MNFSVVIPLYNKELHIERAIKSILGQTCQDFEIIVVNDGSTDRSREVVENIPDSRILIIDQPNRGVSAARNRGAELARYEFIAFLDADDEWLPGFLQNIRILIESFPNCGAYATAKQTVRPDGSIFLMDLSKIPPEPWAGILPNVFALFQDGGWLHSSSTIVPKRIFLEVGGFPVGVKLLEDVTCWVKIAIHYPIAFTSKRLVVYHQDASNRSNVHKNIILPPFIQIVRDALSAGLIAEENQNDAREFIAQRQIFIAIANIMDGNSKYARELLFMCRHTKKYKNLWFWWRFWASFPPGWPKRILLIKQKFLEIRPHLFIY